MSNEINFHYEYIFKLYLRLNGFLSSNLILHSPIKSNINSEIDIIACKMPYHFQSDRRVDELISFNKNERICILIADIKNVNKVDKVEFNKSLRNSNDSITKLIEWLGLYKNINDELIEKFKQFLNHHNSINNIDEFIGFNEDFEFGKINIVFTFFCPSLEKWNGKGYKYLNFDDVFDFIWKCLNTNDVIETCAREYTLQGWNELKKYVDFFKDQKTKPTKEMFEEKIKNYR